MTDNDKKPIISAERTFNMTAPPPRCPECRDGKHRNCDGTALDPATDTITRCTCYHGDAA